MYKGCFLLILFFSFSGCVSAQIEKEYSSILRKEDKYNVKLVSTYRLTLLNDSKYIMYIAEHMHNYGGDFYIRRDNYRIIPISVGQYQYQDSSLFLTDAYTNALWIYKCNYPYLEPVKVAPCINSHLEIENNQNIDRPIFSQTIDQWKKNGIVENKIFDFQNSDFQQNDFQNGIYKGISLGLTLCYLDINSNGQYLLFLQLPFMIIPPPDGDIEMFRNMLLDNAIILSSGTWEQKKNILELSDTNLTHTFYVLIKEHNELQLLMFGDNEGMFLKIK